MHGQVEEFSNELNKYFIEHFDPDKFKSFGAEFPNNALHFPIGGFRCQVENHFFGSMIMVNFYKKYIPLTKKQVMNRKVHFNFPDDKDGNIGKYIKRLSLTNFIFKHCNPKGLEILEKSILGLM